MPFDNLVFALIIGVKFHVSEYIETLYILKVASCTTLVNVFYSGYQDIRITENWQILWFRAGDKTDMWFSSAVL